MPAPIAVAIAATVARALATQAAKQGVKQLTKNEARIVARKAVRQIAAKSRSQSDKSRAVSGKQLDALINRANASARSTKPVRNAKGLRTTTGQGGKRISNVSATRIAEQSAGPKARRLGGEAGLRAVAPKPGVRVTTKSSGGGSIKVGPSQKINVKLIKRAEGPSRLSGKEFQKPPVKVKEISSERTPTFGKEKITTSKPVRRETNKKGSAITIRKTQPRKPAEVRAQRAKERRDKLRKVLTPRVNPSRPKTKPKSGVDKSSRDYNVEGKDTAQGMTIRGRFYPDRNPGLPARGQSRQGTIESRLESRSERPTIGSTRRGEKGEYDSEAEALLNRSIRALGSPKASAKERVKPGQRTKVATAIKKGDPAKIKGSIRNMRKVLKEREIKEAAERMRKAEEAAKKRGTK